MRGKKRATIPEDKTSAAVTGLQSQKAALQKELEYMKTDEYLEAQAHNNLNMIKPNEKVYVSQTELKINPNGETGSTPTLPKPLPNYRKWLNLFL